MWCGIDLGSRSVKIVVVDERGKFDYYVYDTAFFYRNYARREDGKLAVDIVSLLKPRTLKLKVVGTGYGRQTITLKNARTIPEIKAHVIGAINGTGLSDFTLLDLGGQDSKVALVRGGQLVDFQTNDRCAASTGRYLENMAAVLDISLAELGRHFENPVELTSTCAIFGETELIGKIVEGYRISELAAGVNYTIFKRIRPMLSALYSDILVFTGGVAHNPALREIISREMEMKVVVPQRPEFAGAVGCCVVARSDSI